MWIYIVSMLTAFLVTYAITPFFICYFKKAGIVTRDVHKRGKPLVPNSAGIPLILGMLSGIFLYVFLKVFLFEDRSGLVEIFACTTSVLLIALTGFLDDINSSQVRIRGFWEGKAGLKRWQKPLLTLPAALPLMAIMAGTSTMSIPFVGDVDFGIVYPLLLVPIGVVGAANMINMLDGFNGLDTGMGLVYTLSLGLYAYLHGRYLASILFLITFGALLAVFKYNFYPAKVLSGDSLTYSLGAVVACGAIVGNMEKAALITMLPFIIQGALKFYSFFRLGYFASDLGILERDGSIKNKYGKCIYSWTHLIMNLGRRKEWEISVLMILIQLLFSLLPFLSIF